MSFSFHFYNMFKLTWYLWVHNLWVLSLSFEQFEKYCEKFTWISLLEKFRLLSYPTKEILKLSFVYKTQKYIIKRKVEIMGVENQTISLPLYNNPVKSGKKYQS